MFLTAAVTTFTFSGCSEDSFSSDYDINLPAAKVTAVSNNTPFVDDEITLTGENLNTVTSVSVGTATMKTVSIDENGTSMIVKVPRTIDAGNIVLMNKYNREFSSDLTITPQFYPAVVATWPSQIEKGKPFTLKGDNMDLLKEVKLKSTVVGLNGAASASKADYASSAVELEIGEKVTIEVTPKAGEKQTSPEIEVVKPSDTYMPKQTLMILSFDSKYSVTNGSDAATCTMKEVQGMFGKAFRVTAASGDGWNGTYCKINNDNNGAGFDLSSYHHPCITMLINTYGSTGYVQPILTDAANGEQDRHLTGAFGYGDDYKCKTSGWEWRSYDLTTLGFPLVLGKLDKIGVQFRGGNVNGTPFDIAVDQVMITDGPLNPTVAWDAETDATSYEAGQFNLVATGSNSALTGNSQGNKYANYSGASSTDWSKKVIAVTKCPALDPTVYQNGVWINFLVNTGSKGGYVQPCMGSGWMNLMKSQGYGDDYQVNPTNNAWQWRSIKVVPGEGDLSGWTSSAPFDFKVQILGGNYQGADMDISCDYFVFTTAPMDPNLNTDELK
jgi:hypothetical protein